MRRGKKIHSPRKDALAFGWVSNDLTQHPKRAELDIIYAQYVRPRAGPSARKQFAECIHWYEFQSREAKKLPTLAEEREDLDNLVSAIRDVRKRLQYFPPLASADVQYRAQKSGEDFKEECEELERLLSKMEKWVVPLVAAKLKVGHRPRTVNSVARRNLQLQLSNLLMRYGRSGAADAQSMASDVAHTLLK
jgi:hypothetical protein